MDTSTAYSGFTELRAGWLDRIAAAIRTMVRYCCSQRGAAGRLLMVMRVAVPCKVGFGMIVIVTVPGVG
ncbi:hypothetical protein [Polaromonas sp.]|uniref:hypothetical protein n=1 Tax=Polaromonas sp. TaxID=1869339 RepID=UPI0025CFC567|nr:hypothetical protein [Polaromonas sp.]